MEFDREKSFGHPVLRPVFNDERIENMDFACQTFEVKFALEVSINEPNKGVLKCMPKISLEEIITHIKNGNLKIVIDIRCKKTFYSKAFDINFEKKEIEIDLQNLRDMLEIHPYIIATKDFTFSSESIHNDYGRSSFNLLKGDIIAWHPPAEFCIAKEQYRSISSIIHFQCDPKLNFGEYYLATNHDYVKLRAHKDFIEKCNHAERGDAQYGLLASLYVPVIAELFLKMINNQEEVRNYRWAEVLKSKSAEKQISWEEKNDAFKNAQKILKNPLADFSKRGF